ncbi:glycoside hydrolase family 5 protein [Geodermatophilus chilensis]|uniref:glycoside hydrolase family 5 protein n=1 Tax=Geodermatophilus chilensis TaxID=2035835 RepID=UPI001300011D|nr:cellulase family glycosylhydrolase [Geodermatophilus chilensis]
MVALVGATGLWWFSARHLADDGSRQPAPAEERQAEEDALQRRVVSELEVFTDWLARNGVEGYVGEVGIPNDGDVERWLRLAERWFEEADEAGLWVDVWSSGEWWGSDYVYSPFTHGPNGGPLAITTPTGELVARHARDGNEPRGVNVSGGEFGAPGSTDEVTVFSNENPGEYGRDYRYDSQESFDYLASEGIDTVRLPFRWERIQPALGEELDQEELGRLRGAVGRAHAAGLEVILDVHNYGAYHLIEGTHGVRRAIGSDELSQDDFADLWRRLSEAFREDPGVLAYDLMNEPSNLPEVDGRSPAQVWEEASQAAVTAIRTAGDDTLIMVAGYQYSHAGEWPEQHPQAWIEDPEDNVKYEAHHYWKRGDGNSYAMELAYAEESGY